MKKLRKPTSQLTETLFYLLRDDFITYAKIYANCGILNLSARLSELKLDFHLPIETKVIKTKNKFDRDVRYGSWQLTDKKLGLEVYNDLLD